MVRPADQDTTAIEKVVCCSRLPGGGSVLTMQGHTGKPKVRQEAADVGEEGTRPLLWFLQEKNQQDRVSSLGLAGTSGSLFVWFLIRVIRAGGCGLEWGVVGVGSRWTGSHVRPGDTDSL